MPISSDSCSSTSTSISSSPPLSLLSDSEWQGYFPREKYQKREPVVKQHSLKFLIALNQSDHTLLSHIEKMKTAKPDQMNSSFTDRKLTALHMAVMKNRPEVAKALLKAGANPNACDAYGWTPLHHAALVSDELAQILLGAGASKDARTNLDGSYQDLKYLSGREVSTTSTGDRIFYRDETSGEINISKISVEKFQELTGLSLYSDEPIFPPDQLKKLWTCSTVGPFASMGASIAGYGIKTEELLKIMKPLLPDPTITTDRYEQFRKDPPLLVVGRDPVFVRRLGEDKCAPTYGVYAKQQIGFGDLIAEYTGKVVDEEKFRVDFLEHFASDRPVDDYILGDLDARQVGNISRFINEGFPNSGIFPLENCRGCSHRGVVACIEEGGIAADEQIFFDYGPKLPWLKWGHYVISNKDEILQFFGKELQASLRQRKDLIEVCQRSEGTKDVRADRFRLNGLNARIMFPLMSPAVLILLTFTKTVNLDVWKDLCNDNAFTSQIRGQLTLGHSQWIERLISLLGSLECELDLLAKTGQEGKQLAEQMRGFILDQLDKLKVTQVVYGIGEMNYFLLGSKRVIADNNLRISRLKKRWSYLYKKWTKSCSDYDVYRNDHFVLSACSKEKTAQFVARFMEKLNKDLSILMR